MKAALRFASDLSVSDRLQFEYEKQQIINTYFCFISVAKMRNWPFKKNQLTRLPETHHCMYACSMGTFNMPTSYQQWVWEIKAYFYWSMVTCQGSTRSELP